MSLRTIRMPSLEIYLFRSSARFSTGLFGGGLLLLTLYEVLEILGHEPFHKTETDAQTWRTDVWLPRGRRVG